MPTIKARKQANGSTRYTAVVRIHRGTTVLHQESRTFTHRSAALNWVKHREVALKNPAELARQKQSTPTLAELIRWYIDTFETISRWQRPLRIFLANFVAPRSSAAHASISNVPAFVNARSNVVAHLKT
jgi:hypothetical protein